MSAADPDRIRERLEKAAAEEAVKLSRGLMEAMAVERAAIIARAEVPAAIIERIIALRGELARLLAGSGFARDLLERTVIQATYGQTATGAGGVTTVTADFVAEPLRDIIGPALKRNPLPSDAVEAAFAKATEKVPSLEAMIDQEASASVGDRVLNGATPEEIAADADRFGESMTTLEQQNAQNGARLDAAADLPDIVAMEYRTLEGAGGTDGRVRENHLAGDGFRAAVDSPYWDELTPPLG